MTRKEPVRDHEKDHSNLIHDLVSRLLLFPMNSGKDLLDTRDLKGCVADEEAD